MSSKLVVCCWDITIFRIFKMAGAAILDFWNRKILLAIGVERVEIHQHAKLCQNQSIGCEDIKVFSDFQDGGILDCRIHKILFADGIWREETHHCTKFCQNRSFHCGDIVILRIFKMAAAILYFWNREILLPIGVEMVETHQYVKFRQNRSIGCKDIKIFRFFKIAAAAIFDFVEFVKFYWLTLSGGPRHITVPNSSKSVVPLWRYWDFSNFKDGRCHHLGFLKSRNCTG